jgi:hypothetical protein
MWSAALAHFDSERAQRVSALSPESEGETPAVVDPANNSFVLLHCLVAVCFFVHITT